MEFLDELYLYGETVLTYRGSNTRYVLRQANAVPAFGRADVSVDIELECLSPVGQ
jgi:hypothetical protein